MSTKKKIQIFGLVALAVLGVGTILTMVGLSNAVGEIERVAVSHTPDAILASAGVSDGNDVSLTVAYYDQKADSCVNIYDTSKSEALYNRQFEWTKCDYHSEAFEQGLVDYYLDDELLINKMDFGEFKQKMESKYWNDTFAAQFCGKEEDTYIDKKKTKKKKLEDNSSLLLGATILSITLFLIFLSSAIIMFVRIRKIEEKFDENKLVNEELKGSEMPILD